MIECDLSGETCCIYAILYFSFLFFCHTTRMLFFIYFYFNYILLLQCTRTLKLCDFWLKILDIDDLIIMYTNTVFNL